MDIKKFYLGYFITLLLVTIIMIVKLSFIDTMAILGTALTGTVIIFVAGFLLYRTYIAITTPTTTQ